MKSVTKWMVAAVGVVGMLSAATPASASVFHVLYSQVGSLSPWPLQVFATETECRQRARTVAETYIQRYREPQPSSDGGYSLGVSGVEPLAGGIAIYERIQLADGYLTTIRAAIYCTPRLSS